LELRAFPGRAPKVATKLRSNVRRSSAGLAHDLLQLANASKNVAAISPPYHGRACGLRFSSVSRLSRALRPMVWMEHVSPPDIAYASDNQRCSPADVVLVLHDDAHLEEAVCTQLQQ
jgi:hypothetical protein